MNNSIDWQACFLVGMLAIALFALGFASSSLFGSSITSQTVAQPVNQKSIQGNQIKLPPNIQSSAPIYFKSFEEEVEYYRKNAKNPNNIDIEQAIRNMDKNFDGQCDKCGMAILHCIENGMENM